MLNEQYVVITPARDEAAYFEKTIASMLAQAKRPRQWVIVDDGSTDGTARLAQRVAVDHHWVKVVDRKDRGYRDVGAGTVEAFNAGLRAVEVEDYKFLCLVDADIVFGPYHFEVLISKFADNPRLGIAAGQVYENAKGRIISIREHQAMTAGAAKCWRKECFMHIGGLVAMPSWDGLDCYRAMMLGWETKTFADEALQIIHLRQIGSSMKSVYHGWMRRGRGMHFLGVHPLWLWASAFYHIADRPYILGGLCMVLGYLRSFFKRNPPYADREFRRFLRQYQIEKLCLAFTSIGDFRNQFFQKRL